jgi:hypothetical protein
MAYLCNHVGKRFSPEFKNKGPKDRNSMEKYVLAYSTN